MGWFTEIWFQEGTKDFSEVSRPVLGALSLCAKQPGDEADHSLLRCGDY